MSKRKEYTHINDADDEPLEEEVDEANAVRLDTNSGCFWGSLKARRYKIKRPLCLDKPLSCLVQFKIWLFIG